MREPSRSEGHPDSESFQCPMCHHDTPVDKAQFVAGRRLCPGCASTWYDEDEDGGEKP